MKDEIEAIISKAELSIATRVYAEQLSSQFEHQTLFSVISDYMRRPALGRREWIICIKTLCQIDKDAANKRFVEALQVDDADKRFRIVKLLGTCGTEHIVPTLVKMLQEDPEPGIRLMVAATLGAIGDKRALPVLEWSAENDHAVNHDDIPVSYEAKQAIESLKALSER